MIVDHRPMIALSPAAAHCAIARKSFRGAGMTRPSDTVAKAASGWCGWLSGGLIWSALIKAAGPPYRVHGRASFLRTISAPSGQQHRTTL